MVRTTLFHRSDMAGLARLVRVEAFGVGVDGVAHSERRDDEGDVTRYAAETIEEVPGKPVCHGPLAVRRL